MENEIRINGKTRKTPSSSTVLSLLSDYNLNPSLVVVEINEVAVEKSAYETTILNNGDSVEILEYVGGG